MTDIVFFTHANANTGFGHFARCINISKILKLKNRNLKISFAGECSKDMQSWTKRQIDVSFIKEVKNPKVAIYDRMDDIEDPSIVNIKLIEEIKKKSDHLVLFANGIKLPNLNFIKDITVIGYKLGLVKHDPPYVYWNLKYAPVNKKQQPIEVNKIDLLVALGGAKDEIGLKKVFKAIAKIENIMNVGYLDSPVNPVLINKTLLRSNQHLNIYKNLPEIQPLLFSAEMVITSYGHLAYETIAYETPLCLLNQKLFQDEYAQKLDERCLCVSAGLLNNLSIDDIVNNIKITMQKSEKIIKNSKGCIDGNGLQRTSEIIYNLIDK